MQEPNSPHVQFASHYMQITMLDTREPAPATKEQPHQPHPRCKHMTVYDHELEGLGSLCKALGDEISIDKTLQDTGFLRSFANKARVFLEMCAAFRCGADAHGGAHIAKLCEVHGLCESLLQPKIVLQRAYYSFCHSVRRGPPNKPTCLSHRHTSVQEPLHFTCAAQSCS